MGSGEGAGAGGSSWAARAVVDGRQRRTAAGNNRPCGLPPGLRWPVEPQVGLGEGAGGVERPGRGWMAGGGGRRRAPAGDSESVKTPSAAYSDPQHGGERDMDGVAGRRRCREEGHSAEGGDGAEQRPRQLERSGRLTRVGTTLARWHLCQRARAYSYHLPPPRTSAAANRLRRRGPI